VDLVINRRVPYKAANLTSFSRTLLHGVKENILYAGNLPNVH
jgi:hypothetical protein